MQTRYDEWNNVVITEEFRLNTTTGDEEYFEEKHELPASIDQLIVTVDVVDGDRKAPNPHDYITFKSNGLPYSEVTHGMDLGWAYNTITKGRFIHGPHGTNWNPLNPEEDPNQLVQTDDQALKGLYEQMRGQANIVVDIFEGKEVVNLVRDAVSMKRNWVAHMGKAMGVTVRHNRRAGEPIFRDKRGGMMSMGTLEWRKAPRKRDGSYDWKEAVVVDIANFSTEISALWLGFRYGVTPLVLSIADGLDLALKPLRKGGGLQTVQARGKMVSEAHKGTSHENSDGLYTEWNERLETRVEYQLLYVLPDDVLQMYDASTLNPVSLGWEVLPVMSIVGDWMFGISDYLRNIESALIFASGFGGGYKTTTFERVSTYTAHQHYVSTGGADQPLDGVTMRTMSGGYVKELRQKRRVVLTTPPFPNMPTLKRDNMPWKRVADVGAFFTLMALDLDKIPGRI